MPLGRGRSNPCLPRKRWQGKHPKMISEIFERQLAAPASKLAKMRQRCAWFLVLLTVGLAGPGFGLVMGSDLPPVEQVLNELIARTQAPHIVESPSSYLCTKQTITEEFDTAGNLTSRKVKIGESESKHGAAEANKWGSKNGISLDADLIRRYQFTLVQREMLNGRSTFVLSFVPKTRPPPIRHFQDRLLNRAMGTIWVDEQEHELVKANICLAEPVSFGILGAVDAINFGLERERADGGDWLTRCVDTAIRARKFFKPIQTRKHEEWRDFRRLAVR